MPEQVEYKASIAVIDHVWAFIGSSYQKSDPLDELIRYFDKVDN